MQKLRIRRGSISLFSAETCIDGIKRTMYSTFFSSTVRYYAASQIMNLPFDLIYPSV